jgi:hypothetical protein
LATGTNPLFAPQVSSLFGFNIPGVPLISAQEYFLTQMESWFSSIPLNSQWVVLIDTYPRAISSDIIQNLEYVGGDKKGWDVSQPKGILTSYFYQKVVGCLFAQGVNIPNEKYDVLPAIVHTDFYHVANIVLNIKTNTDFMIPYGTPMMQVVPFKRSTNLSSIEFEDESYWKYVASNGFGSGYIMPSIGTAGPYRRHKHKVDIELAKKEK